MTTTDRAHRRGDLIGVAVDSIIGTASGKGEQWTRITLAVVTNLSRDKEIRGFRELGATRVQKHNPTAGGYLGRTSRERRLIRIDSTRLDVAATEANYAETGRAFRAFDTLDETRDYLRQFVRAE